MNLGVWLLAMVTPMVGRILFSLGFAVVSIVGVEASISAIRTQFIADMNSMPAVWLQFALYLWIGKGLGVVFGALTAKLALWAIQNTTAILGRSTG